MFDQAFMFVRKCMYFLFARLKQRSLLLPYLPYEQHIWHNMASCLGVSLEAARGIYKQGSLDNAKFWLDNKWLALAPLSSVVKLVDKIEIENRHYFDEALSLDRPILIISMHMGSYYLGFLKLAATVDKKREISVIKLNEATAQEAKIHSLFEKRYGRLKPIRISEGPADEAFLALRRGGVLAVLTDMEARVSDRSEVEFMGHSCCLQNGPAKLALTTGAVVVPIVNYTDKNGRHKLRIEPLFIARREANEDNKNAVKRITASIASAIDGWVRLAPAQVHYWSEICRIMQNTPDTPKAKHISPVR
ncbi:MAG: lysophospholipid acyltransferase family protein [Gallionella sp.]